MFTCKAFLLERCFTLFNVHNKNCAMSVTWNGLTGIWNLLLPFKSVQIQCRCDQANKKLCYRGFNGQLDVKVLA